LFLSFKEVRNNWRDEVSLVLILSHVIREIALRLCCTKDKALVALDSIINLAPFIEDIDQCLSADA